MKAIILAGGFGTRLRPAIGDDIPKCLAPVMGRPVISYVINRMKTQGITDITLSLHHKADMFIKKFGHMKYKVEETPLGTGGAIKNCIEGTEPVLVVNGDTISAINYNEMIKRHVHPLTIAVSDNGENAGAYIVDPQIFDNFPQKCFSFEKDVIPVTPFSVYNISWFTDIGTPEAYAKIQKDWI